MYLPTVVHRVDLENIKTAKAAFHMMCTQVPVCRLYNLLLFSVVNCLRRRSTAYAAACFHLDKDQCAVIVRDDVNLTDLGAIITC